MMLLRAVFPVLVATAATADPDPISRGAEIYSTICRECHGPTATEGQSGDIRGLSLATVTGAVRSGPGMIPTVPLMRDEIAAVTAYLASLGRQ